MSNVRPIAVGAVTVALAGLLASCGSNSAATSSGSGSAVTSAAADSATTTSSPAVTASASTPARPTSAVAAPATSSSAPPGSVVPTARSSSSSASKVVVSEAQNGGTVTVNRGADIFVTLHSTYWQFQQASAPKVLVQAAPEIQGDPPSGPGGPGSGRGTARESYHAQQSGTATITATRTTCGEALRCSKDQSVYRITVIVR